MLIFSCTAGALVIVYEFALGLTLAQWGGVKILYNIFRFIGAHYCANLTLWLQKLISGGSNHWFRNAIADALALSVYEIPLYALSAWIMGVDTSVIILLSVIFIFHNIIFGWFYGWLLVRLRALIGAREESS